MKQVYMNFDECIKSLVEDINNIIDDHLDMIKMERNDYKTVKGHISSMQGWFDGIQELKSLNHDRKGMEYLKSYYDERGFDKDELMILDLQLENQEFKRVINHMVFCSK